MKHIESMALLLTLVAPAVYANDKPVSMRFSGNGAPSAANLQQPNTGTAEENVAGIGTLGEFTFRNITAQASSPQPSSTCSGPNQLYFSRVAGGGIFRFRDGSLLNVKLTQGGDCIDFGAQEGHCTLTLQVTGGTGRFKNAVGSLTYTETGRPVLADASNTPIFFTETGGITGTISGDTMAEEPQDGSQ